jgi:NAD(P)-dependent dehydrogenase (short-subunit alcohol dehydrogenase family)
MIQSIKSFQCLCCEPTLKQLTRSNHVLCMNVKGEIGKAIAKGLLSQGAAVVLTARRTTRLQQAKMDLLSAITSLPHERIFIPQCDISKEDETLALFAEIDKHYGRIDIVVNNAGANVAKPILDLTAADFEMVWNVNVVGAFLCSREAMKRMKDGGRIINIGSISATSPRPNSTAYTTSKFALKGLTQSLALDCREMGIAVGIIHPGNVASELLSPEDVEIRGKTEGFLHADDVANCVVTMATLPYSANVLELTVIPTTQPLVGRG